MGMLDELRNIQQQFTRSKIVNHGGPPKWIKSPEVKDMHAKIALAKRNGQTDDIKKYKRHYRKLCKALAMKEEQREIQRNKNRNIWAAIKPKTRENQA